MAITERRLTAILAADVCDFSRMMGENEDRTIKNLRTCRELIEGSITSHKGNIFNTAGDSIVAEFGSVVDAVNCAVSFQETLRDRNSSVPETARMEFRVGINLGDIIIEEDNRYGDGINIAARLEGLSEPGGICISGSVYSDIKSKLNLEFGAMGEQVLKNIAQPVSAYKIDFGGDDPTPIASIANLESTPIEQAESLPNPSATASSSQRDKPSIAVLPFDNMSNDPEQEYFTDGITEDIITELSRSKGLRVIARNSTFSYKGQSPDIRDVGKTLKVNHVLEGSVRKVGDNVRITAQLIFSEDNSHRWAEKFDGSLNNIFELQSEISKKIADQLNVEFFQTDMQFESDVKERKEAADLARKARASSTPATHSNSARAKKMYEKALSLDPECDLAHAGIAMITVTRAWHDITDKNLREETINLGLESAKKAVEINPKNTNALYAICIGCLVKGDYERARTIANENIKSNPGDVIANSCYSVFLNQVGDYAEALKFAHKARELDPLDRQTGLGLINSEFFNSRYKESIKIFEDVFGEFGEFDINPYGWAIVIMCYFNVGQTDRAKQSLESLKSTHPDLTPETLRYSLLFSEEEEKDKYMAGIKEVGFN